MSTLSCDYTNSSGFVNYPETFTASSIGKNAKFVPKKTLGKESIVENVLLHNTNSESVQTATISSSGLFPLTMRDVVKILSSRPKHHLSAFLGRWKGDDLDDLLSITYKTRSQIK